MKRAVWEEEALNQAKDLSKRTVASKKFGALERRSRLIRLCIALVVVPLLYLAALALFSLGQFGEIMLISFIWLWIPMAVLVPYWTIKWILSGNPFA